jgi:hypothetical protein
MRRMTVNEPRTRSRRLRGAALAAIAAGAVVAAACGGAGASTSSTATAGSTNASAADAGRTPGRFRNGTPPPDAQTAIAEGTPFAGFRNGTPPAAVQTAIAEGTPFGGFGNRTPSADVQTAIAEGTPASALRGGVGGANGARVITALAGILGVDEATLRNELQAPGASIETVAAAHGVARATVRQQLIDAVRQSLTDAVKNGTLTQAMADQSASQFEANVDNTLDRVGGGGGGGGGG